MSVGKHPLVRLGRLCLFPSCESKEALSLSLKSTSVCFILDNILFLFIDEQHAAEAFGQTKPWDLSLTNHFALNVLQYVFISNCWFPLIQDIQFVFKISFGALQSLQKRSTQAMSIMEVIGYYHPECKDIPYLEEEDCKFLIIMEAFDCYQAPLDWEVPSVHSSHTKSAVCILHIEEIQMNHTFKLFSDQISS